MISKRMFVGGLLLALGGCATAETVRDAPMSSGTARSFAASYDRTTAATLDALRQFNVNITSTQEQPTGLLILVTKSLSAFSWGEVGRVAVERSAAPPTTVRVVWEKRSQLQITGTGETAFSNELFDGIQQKLAAR